MNNPDNGKPEKPERKSEVKVIYTNEALYIAASLYDNEPLKIGKELTLRDNFVTADHFGVQLNGYNDGQQEFRFFVSAAGVQMDCVYTENNGEDFSWDAIWDSQTAITETGWVVEMKIPYAALRFPTDIKQTWGLNFYREIIRDRQQFSWNLINNNINNTLAGLSWRGFAIRVIAESNTILPIISIIPLAKAVKLVNSKELHTDYKSARAGKARSRWKTVF